MYVFRGMWDEVLRNAVGKECQGQIIQGAAKSNE